MSWMSPTGKISKLTYANVAPARAINRAPLGAVIRTLVVSLIDSFQAEARALSHQRANQCSRYRR